MTGTLCLTALLVFAALPGADLPGAAKPDPRVAAVAALFAPKADFASLCTPDFLKAVPAEKCAGIVKLYADALGTYDRAEGTEGAYTLQFSNGSAPCRISLDAGGRIAGLWFGEMSRRDDTPETLRAEFARLPGTVSVALLEGGTREVFALNADRPLAIGSAFKIYILKALRERIAAGELKETDVVPLDAALRSLPSGMLQEWAPGTPVTLRTLANLMISISDNTATDHLLDRVGRERVERGAPGPMRPFLSTREMFCFKTGTGAAELRERFLAADVAARRALLAELAGRLPELTGEWSRPIAIDGIEWHATTRELAETLFEIGDDPALAINPGLVEKRAWDRVAYKGGSEPGVLNYTILLKKTPSAPVYVLSATINDPAAEVRTEAFTSLVTRLIALVRDGALARQRP